MDANSIVTAIIAFLGGSGFNALLKYARDSKGQDLNNEQILRAEMKEQFDLMKERIDFLEREVNTWRDKYLELYQDYADLKAKFDNKNPSV